MNLPRHTRQIMLREIGGAGQAKLRDASVRIVGAGGLGGPVALYLAAAGIGRIILMDPDVVEDSNLQRQVQFIESDIGASKVQALAKRLRDMDGSLEIDTVNHSFAGVGSEDIIIDGTDNFKTRFAVNAASVAAGKPLISGAVAGWTAQVGIFTGRDDISCYRCFVPDAPPEAATCEAEGIVGAVAGIAGSIMALEAIKLITGAGQPLFGRLWLYDGLAATSRTISIPCDPACECCGVHAHPE